MECPRCQGQDLTVRTHLGIEMDTCGSCKGMWLDYPELDQLEDRVLDEDRLKGSMMYRERNSDIHCPKCRDLMTTFNYRAYDLPIDFCNNNHGFWLDAGEEKRVLELMEKRTRDLKRTASAEMEWGIFLRGLSSKKTSSSSGSFLGKIKGWLTGRR